MRIRVQRSSSTTAWFLFQGLPQKNFQNTKWPFMRDAQPSQARFPQQSAVKRNCRNLRVRRNCKVLVLRNGSRRGFKSHNHLKCTNKNIVEDAYFLRYITVPNFKAPQQVAWMSLHLRNSQKRHISINDGWCGLKCHGVHIKFIIICQQIWKLSVDDAHIKRT
jgi:hypothetical protein